MRLSFWNVAGLLGVFLSGPLAFCAEDQPHEFERPKLHEFIAGRIAGYSLLGAADNTVQFERTESPILRYSDPARTYLVEGAMYLWLDGKRPVAAGTIWIDIEGRSTREFSALADVPLVGRDAQEKLVWEPEGAVFANQPIDRSPEPAKSRPLRLAQMRSLVRRFAVTCYRREDRSPFELRLMPQPLYRYSSQEHGILDGAIFAFAESNDPDLLVIITARSDPGRNPPSWSCSLARVCSMKLTVRLDDAEIHTFEDYWLNPRSIRDGYVEAKEGTFEPARMRRAAP